MAWAVDRDDGSLLEIRVGADFLSHLPAVHFGQANVHENQIGLFPQGHLPTLLAIYGFDQFVVVFEELDQEVAIHFHIFYDKDFFHDEFP